MQRVTELVERGRDFIPRQQRRLAGRRLRHVEMVRHHRAIAGERRLRDVGVHPRATALRLPRVDVENEDRERLAVRIEHVVGANVGVIERQVRAALEAQAIELIRREEHALLVHVRQLEIGLELRFVERELLRAPSRCSTPSPTARA